MNKDLFYQEAHVFLDFLLTQMKKSGISLRDHWSIDHICYRTESENSYQKQREGFLSLGTLLIESEVNGRLIATYQLFEPISFLGRKIRLVELPAPKPHQSVKEGFEHIEVVCDCAFEDLVKQYPCSYFNQTGLTKLFNQELELGFEDCALKFHHLSLESVIRLERHGQAWVALKQSRLLEKLRAFRPALVGDLLLGIEAPVGGIKILLEARDFNQLLEIKEFSWTLEVINEVQTLVTEWVFEGTLFVLQAQHAPVHGQAAFRCFQVEERIIALNGEGFFEKLIQLRKKKVNILGLHELSDLQLLSFLRDKE